MSIDNTIVCQGKLLKLRCHNSALTLTIYSATFGRTEPGGQICPYEAWAEDMDFLCAESDVTTRLQRICSRRTKCRIQVERSVFGRDLCPGKHLYLRVIYGCGKSTLSLPSSKFKKIHSLNLLKRAVLANGQWDAYRGAFTGEQK